MAKLSIAELQRRLPIGTEITAEFIGKVNTRMAPDMKISKRKVVNNTKRLLESEFLDGPKKGQSIFLDWKGVTADERDGSIYLSQSFSPDTSEEFLKITLSEVALPA